MNDTSADAVAKAQAFTAHRLWLQDSQTKKFFAHLAARKQKLQDAAATHAVTCGIDNFREHNSNVRAQEVKTIIETYADRTNNPYTETDRTSPGPDQG